jgi:hypothetical protein
MLPTWDKPEFNSEYYEDQRYLSLNERGMFVANETSRMNGHGGKIIDLISDDRKVVIPIQTAYFHVLTEILPIIVSEINDAELDGKTVHFVLGIDAGQEMFLSTHVAQVYEHVNNQIVRHGHKVSSVALSSNDELLIDNFAIYRQCNSNLALIRNVSAFVLDGVVDLSKVEPTRKVYLSRSKTLSNSVFRATDEEYLTLSIDEIREKYKYKISDRVDDEALLEEYFSGMGFEIIYPEDIKSFEDQLKLVSEIKTVVSITSAGLTSMMFMKPGGVVIELSTPLDILMGEDKHFISIHPHYLYLAHEFKHIYVSLPHSRSATEIVERITSDSKIKNLFSN